jgi:hypothetical protein
MIDRPRRALSLAAALLLAACNGVEGGNQDAATASCERMCFAQQQGEGCGPIATPCDGTCTTDAMRFGEECLVKAKAYYDCAAGLSWSCPTAPDQPETADGACDAEEHAWLVCKVTGE